MLQKNIIVPKTARYFVTGTPSAEIETVWIVCHGYGQLANYFLKNFSVLDNGKNLIVAPEGLHRFYWEKFSGRVVASWMTKEDRGEDIRDYVNFLDLVFKEVTGSCSPKVKINVLGFSQGTATACRWLALSDVNVDHLFIWAGTFPEDVIPGKDNSLLKVPVTIVIGDSDEFITMDQMQKQKLKMEGMGLNIKLVTFSGKHEILPETLGMLARS